MIENENDLKKNKKDEKKLDSNERKNCFEIEK